MEPTLPEKTPSAAGDSIPEDQETQQSDKTSLIENASSIEGVTSTTLDNEASQESSASEQISSAPQDQVNNHGILKSDIAIDLKIIQKWAIIIGMLLILCLLWYFANQQVQRLQTTSFDRSDVTITVSDEQEEGTVTIIEQSSQLLNAPTDGVVSANLTTIKAYYLNSVTNPNLRDCSKVAALEKQTERKYPSQIINTMRGLLEPLTPEQQQAGWSSAVPAGVLLKSVMIRDGGVAEVNFTSGLKRVAGSCAVTAVRAQIEQTLKQFPGVKSVRICIDGNCDQSQILQP